MLYNNIKAKIMIKFIWLFINNNLLMLKYMNEFLVLIDLYFLEKEINKYKNKK